MKILSKLPLYLRFLFVSYGIGLLCFTALRLLFYFHNKEIGHDIPAATLVMSFIIGLRFDVVICSYILCLPCLLLGLLSFFKPLPLLLKTTTVITITLFGIAFFIAAADIPYYTQFNSRISVAALNWADSPAVMFSVMFGEWFHWVLFLFFLVLLGIFAFLLTKAVAIQSARHQPKAMNLLVFLLTGTLVFFGMRGRFETKSPIRWGTAFFSEYFFANQMALNPVFTFIRTGLDAIKGEDRIDFIPDKEALQLLKKNLGLPQSNDAISRRENIGLEAKRMNVVLVLMESMSAGWLERYGNTSGL
ncbi:MAG: hypothetical protein ACE5DN_04095, partial [Flavobacteriales bacterium]